MMSPFAIAFSLPFLHTILLRRSRTIVRDRGLALIAAGERPLWSARGFAQLGSGCFCGGKAAAKRCSISLRVKSRAICRSRDRRTRFWLTAKSSAGPAGEKTSPCHNAAGPAPAFTHSQQMGICYGHDTTLLWNRQADCINHLSSYTAQIMRFA